MSQHKKYINFLYRDISYHNINFYVTIYDILPMSHSTNNVYSYVVNVKINLPMSHSTNACSATMISNLKMQHFQPVTALA